MLNKIRLSASAGVFVFACPALAQLSANAYTWSAEVHSKQGGIERTTVIDARQKGEIWTFKMECAVVDKAFKQRHVQRFTGTAKWEAGMMLGTANDGMKFTVANRNDGDLAVVTSGDFCAHGKGYLGSGDAFFTANMVEKIGLTDGPYCSASGESVTVAAADNPPFIGIDGMDCQDPVVANGRLVAKTCYTNGGRIFPVTKRFTASGNAFTMDGIVYNLAPPGKTAQSCAEQKAASVSVPAAVASRTSLGDDATTWSHNGSIMLLSVKSGIIVYEEPKASIAGTVKKGTPLFEGRFEDKRVSGTAYVFKRGCEPAPYPVVGRLENNPRGFGQRLVLSGPAPKRDRSTCEIIGTGNAHSRLIFEESGDI